MEINRRHFLRMLCSLPIVGLLLRLKRQRNSAEWMSDSEKEQAFLEGFGAGPVLGCIANTHIYPKALTPEQIAKTYSVYVDEINPYVKRFDWLNRTASKLLREVREEELHLEKPETLMGFPIKWVELPETAYPQGNIVLGDLSCWAPNRVILTDDPEQIDKEET